MAIGGVSVVALDRSPESRIAFFVLLCGGFLFFAGLFWFIGARIAKDR
jgi:hypothetical protein